MNAARVLEQARALGVVLSGGGGKLRYEAPAGRLTAELKALLSAHKAELLAVLTSQTAKLMATLATACEGTELSPETFRELLSPEDVTDILAGDIPAVPALHAYAQSFAEGIRSGRVQVLREETP